MTRFSDQLFDDLMREHGAALAHAKTAAAPKRHLTARPAMLAAGVGGLAVAATVGSLVATGGGTPAYAVTKNSDGTVTLAVYEESGIAEANAKLRAYGDDRLVLVPVEAGCQDINSLPPPSVPAGQITVLASASDGAITVNVHGVPAGDIFVLGIQDLGNGHFRFSTQSASISSSRGAQAGPGNGTRTGAITAPPVAIVMAKLTSGKVPRCVSVPKAGHGQRQR